MKTYIPKIEKLERKWYLVDAKDKVLGKIAAKIADKLRGKDKPIFDPHLDTGDFVIVINAEKIKLTGKKLTDKMYIKHSGFPGGLTQIPAKDLLVKKPTRLIELAVKGMLPKNKLNRHVMKKLKVFAGESHPHQAQNPIPLEI